MSSGACDHRCSKDRSKLSSIWSKFESWTFSRENFSCQEVDRVVTFHTIKLVTSASCTDHRKPSSFLIKIVCVLISFFSIGKMSDIGEMHLKIRELKRIRTIRVAILSANLSANLHAAHFPVLKSRRMVLAGVFKAFGRVERNPSPLKTHLHYDRWNGGTSHMHFNPFAISVRKYSERGTFMVQLHPDSFLDILGCAHQCPMILWIYTQPEKFKKNIVIHNAHNWWPAFFFQWKWLQTCFSLFIVLDLYHSAQSFGRSHAHYRQAAAVLTREVHAFGQPGSSLAQQLLGESSWIRPK